jgi:putative ABC transport system permease protein
VSWRRYVAGGSRDRRRREEFEAHVELYVEQLVARGQPPDEARRDARLRFGNPRSRREEIDDMNRLPLFDSLRRDLSYAFRVLRRSPAFAVTVIVTLAVVIGANSAVFSLADSILLRPLPYPQPDRLAVIYLRSSSPQGQDEGDSVDGWMWEEIRDHATTIDAGSEVGSSGANLVSGDTAIYIQEQRVGAGFFRVLGVSPVLGREFSVAEDSAGGPPVTILSYAMWQRVFHGRAEVLGHTMLLKGAPHTVIGVMPKEFQSTAEADLWTPLRASHTGEGAGTNLEVVARVRPGVTWAAANAELARLSPEATRHFDSNPNVKALLELRPLQADMADADRDPIVMLSAAVAAVLIIACVNIAALLLSRGGARAKEIATRMALGSGRGAVIRQLLVESLVLALIGGGLGLMLGAGALETLKALGGETFSDWARASLDGRVIAVMAGVSILTSLCFGLLPAWQASRIDVNATLLAGGSRSIAGSARRWPRRLLVIAEVTLGVTLLVCTGLLLRTFVKLRSLDPGFNPQHVVTATASMLDARYQTSANVNRLFDTTLDQLSRDPAVSSAGISLRVPFQRLLNDGFRFTDDPSDHGSITNVSYVAGDFFRTLEIPLRAGRLLTVADGAHSAPVVLVNDEFVRVSAGHRSILERRLAIGGAPDRAIVGVVGDVLQAPSGFFLTGMIRGPLTPAPTIYIPAAQATDGFMGVHVWFSPVWSVRSRTPQEGEAAIRRALAAADPLLPVSGVKPMGDVMLTAVGDRRLLMTIVAALTIVALFLSAIGIHGLLAQQVSERTREFGIRMALGASAAQAVRQVVLGALLLSMVGVVLGLGLASIATDLVKSFLWNVTPSDPATYLGAALFLLVVAGGASVLPALKILRLNPAVTLRD